MISRLHAYLVDYERKSHSGTIPRSWMAWAVFFFLVASLIGLVMRFFFVIEIPFLEYKPLLHAHSHLALLGWGFMLVAGAITFTIVKERSVLAKYQLVLWLTIISNVGMMLSFPLQGYGPVSITFSSLFLVGSYIWGLFIFADLKKYPRTISISLIRFSIYWLLLASLGLWAIAPVASLLGRLHPFYFMSVQWFLHFQINGWFVYAVLGLLIRYVEECGLELDYSRKAFLLTSLHASVLLTYALAVSWSTPLDALFYLNATGVVLQAIAYFLILMPLIRVIKAEFFSISWIRLLLYVGLASLLFKAFIQFSLIIPVFAEIAYTIRNFVIGFLHLIMLGSVSLTVGMLAFAKGIFQLNGLAKPSWMLLLIAFLITELLLFGQGLMLWLAMGFLPHYHLLLALASILFPVSVFLIGVSFYQKSKDQTSNYSKPIYQL